MAPAGHHYFGGAKSATTDGKASVRADLFLENGVPYLDTDGVAKNLTLCLI